MSDRTDGRWMSRREFVLAAGGALVLGGALGCARHLQGIPPIVAEDGIKFPYTQYLALNEVGGVALAGPVKIGRYKGNVYVVRQAEGALVLGAECRHLGCDVLWKHDENQFVCPCHDSHFDPTGERLKGPSKKGLRAWTARVEADAIVLTPDAITVRN